MKTAAVEPLDEAECRRLLGTGGVGRIGLSMDALPVVLPVNYTFDGRRIVFRTGEGTKLRAALRNAVVCFEVDEVDVERRTGWSVLATGTARELLPSEAALVESVPEPWAPTDGDHLIAIDVALLAGRRLG